MLLSGRRRELTSPGKRRLAFAGVLVAVLVLHHLLGQWWASWQTSRVQEAQVPARLAVQLTRAAELKAVTPPKAPPKPAARWGRLAPGARTSPPPVTAMPRVEPLVPEAQALLPVLEPLPALVDAAAPGPEWPLSTRLRYQLTGHFGGAVHGDAEVEWLRQGRRYQVRLQVSVGPALAPFVTRQMVSEGELGPEGVRPLRYDEDTRQLLRRRQAALRFADGQVEFGLGSGRREPAPEGVQDTASQFVQLTWLVLSGRLPLTVGAQVTLPLALPRRLYAWRYEVVGQEVLDTPIGTLPAWELRPHVDDARGTLRATVWLAPSLQFLPARIRIVQDDETWVDLRLSEHPQQENAPGRDNPPPSQGDPAS